MPETILDMPETNIKGRLTREWGISVEACPAMATHYIRGVGMSNVGRGYRIIRHRPAFSHVNICLEGAGRAWLNDGWTQFRAGTAGIFPRDRPHGGMWAGQRWRMCWVIYDEPPQKQPLIPGPEIVFTAVDPRPMEWALLGLYHEVNGANDPQAAACHVELIHLQVQRLATPRRRVSRLARLWEAVDANVAHPWTSEELAGMAKMSEVHLRRLTLAEFGRSPLQQVAWLRVRRAAYLLESHTQTVEAASWDVGYKSTSAFTSAFKRWMGRSPRRRNAEAGGAG